MGIKAKVATAAKASRKQSRSQCPSSPIHLGRYSQRRTREQ